MERKDKEKEWRKLRRKKMGEKKVREYVREWKRWKGEMETKGERKVKKGQERNKRWRKLKEREGKRERRGGRGRIDGGKTWKNEGREEKGEKGTRERKYGEKE